MPIWQVAEGIVALGLYFLSISPLPLLPLTQYTCTELSRDLRDRVHLVLCVLDQDLPVAMLEMLASNSISGECRITLEPQLFFILVTE